MQYLGKMKTYTSAEVTDSMVSIGFEGLDRELFKPEKCYDLLGQSGIKHARCQTGWARCEKEPGVYDFAWLDDVVDNLMRRGVLPWFNVGYGNPIYMPNVPNATAVGCVPLLYGERAYTAWKAYLRALAQHYRGRVRCFEIWNEPDLGHFWYPSEPDAALYATLVSDAAEIIKEIIPDARIGGSVSHINFGFTETFARHLRPGCLDFYAFHMYEKRPDGNYLQNVRSLSQIFESHGHHGVALWQGEGGHPTWVPHGHWMHEYGTCNEHRQAVWQLRRYFLDAAAGLERSSFFQMADMWEKPYEKSVEVLAKPAAQGILNGVTYTPKKGYETLSRLAAFFVGQTEPSDCPFAGHLSGDHLPEPSMVCIALKVGGRPIFAYYLPTVITSDFRGRDDFGATIGDVGLDRCITSPVLIDLYDGGVYDIGDHVEKNDTTLTLKDLPIKEYPLVICDAGSFEILPDAPSDPRV